MRFRLVKSYVAGYCRSVPGEEPLVFFLYFKMLLQLLINVNRKTALQRKGMEIQIQIQIQFKPLGNAQILAVS